MRVLITGGSGMLGTALTKFGTSTGHTILNPTRKELDLANEGETFRYIQRNLPDAIVHAAARVGGIAANIAHPVEFLLENTKLDGNLLSAALHHKVQRLIYVGSSCMYPQNLLHPMKESEILTGPLEPTNEGYALSKLVGSRTVQYVAQTTDLMWRNFIPSNLYGPNDHFDPERSHLLAAIIQKVFSAKVNGITRIEMWGDGSVKREFTFVDDIAGFMIHSLENLSVLPITMNIGAGVDHTVQEYYEMVMEILEAQLEIVPDISKPVGMKQKLLDVSIARKFGWEAKTDIRSGIRATIDWYKLESRMKLSNV